MYFSDLHFSLLFVILKLTKKVRDYSSNYKEFDLTVLYIIGFLAVVIILALIAIWINSFSIKEFNYEFFNWGNFIITALGYLALWYGYDWFMEASTTGGDILNGQILIGIGAVFVVGSFLNNIRRTSFFFGIFAGTYQLAIYVPLSIASALLVLLAMAWAMNTKPVYNIN